MGFIRALPYAVMSPLLAVEELGRMLTALTERSSRVQCAPIDSLAVTMIRLLQVCQQHRVYIWCLHIATADLRPTMTTLVR